MSPKLKYSDVLEPFLEYLKPTCIDLKPGDIVPVYRTQSNIPIDEYGEAPRPIRKSPQGAIGQILSPEEVAALTPKQRDKFIGEWGLSCNDSEIAAEQSFKYTYERLRARGASKEELEAFAQERGTYVCRYLITHEAGLITDFDKNGHANFYLYEGVKLEDLRDKEYNYTTIEYQPDED